jgi:hypothetical protein
MCDANRMARRYHWLSEHVASFVDEPHEAVCCDARGDVLNLVAHENDAVRQASAQLATELPDVTLRALEKLPLLKMPSRHQLLPELDVAGLYL